MSTWRYYVALAAILAVAIGLVFVVWAWREDRCQRVGAEFVKTGVGGICVTPDGRVVKP